MRTCSRCKKEKDITEFSKSNKNERNGKQYYSAACKECFKKIREDFKQRNPWSITFRHIYTRCNNENHDSYKNYGAKGVKCLISRDELKALWIRDRAGEMKKPSIDRRDSSKDYTFDNCRYIELSDNSRREGVTAEMRREISLKAIAKKLK